MGGAVSLVAAAAAALLFASATAPASAAVELFVSTKGSDAWAGRSDRPGPNGPFATLRRAAEEIARLKKAGKLDGGVTVWVLGGTYYLSEPIILGPEHSGTAQAPVVIRPRPGEKASLVGGKTIPAAAFRPYRGKIVQCDLKAVGLEGVYFRQLFFRGRRQPLARYPNADPNDPHGGKWAFLSSTDPNLPGRGMVCQPDVRLAAWKRPSEAVVHIHPKYDWAFADRAVERVDPARRLIVLKQPVPYGLAPGDRYWVDNVFEELDSPGEWYIDRETWTLYFWPPEPIRDGDVVVPLADHVFELSGAKHITVRGFDIQATVREGVRIENCESCTVAACTVHNTGGWGIVIDGGHNNGAVGNDVFEAWDGGIGVSGGDRKTLEPSGNFADNNYIHHCARSHRTYRNGINLNGVGNRASHNLIHDMPHIGISLSGNDNVVEYNIVHHVNLEAEDSGGLYWCSRDWTKRGNIIRYNIFHHCGGFGKVNSWQPVRDGKCEYAYPNFTWGVYLDDPTSGTLVYGNILYKVPICGFMNHGGRDNTFENNIVVDCPGIRESALSPTWSWWPRIIKALHTFAPPGSIYLKRYPELARYSDDHPEAMTGVKFIRNIVYWTVSGSAWIRRKHGPSVYGGENKAGIYLLSMRRADLDANIWDYNCIYVPPQLEPVVVLGIRGEGTQRLTWDKWRALGKDSHSVLADPLLVDPARGDFRLRPNSPALKLGFKPIPVEKIGPYESELRASWPIREAPGAAARGDFETHFAVELYDYAPAPARKLNKRSGMPNFLAKAAAHKTLRVAYFGGGIHPPGGWRKQVLDWLRRRTGCQVEEIDAGVCDCVRGSAFSVFRTEHDVLRYDPDLVLVDFVRGDVPRDYSDVQRAVEGIVRKIWRHDPTIDILFFYAFQAGFEKSYAQGRCPGVVSAYERVAEHYGVPSINPGLAIAAMARDGKLVITGKPEDAKAAGKILFSTDGVRPTPEADEIYARAIIEAFEQMWGHRGTVRHQLKSPLSPANYENARQIPITRDMLTGSWRQLPPDDPTWRHLRKHFDAVWFTDQPGAKLTFTFTGTQAGLYWIQGPNTGQVRVTVDGRDVGVKGRPTMWWYFYHQSELRLVEKLEPREHTVTVELLGEPPDRSEAIERAKQLGRYRPEDYQGVTLRIGWIRIR